MTEAEHDRAWDALVQAVIDAKENAREVNNEVLAANLAYAQAPDADRDRARQVVLVAREKLDEAKAAVAAAQAAMKAGVPE